MEEFNLRTFENLGLQLFELIVSFFRTILHLITRPKAVFGTIRIASYSSREHGQEVYGDGVIGYTSPVLFVITSIVLQLVADWSMTFYASSAGQAQADLSLGGVVLAVQFLFFAVICSIMASRVLRDKPSQTGIREAFYVTCYAGGFGLFRSLAVIVGTWFNFAIAINRGDPGLLFYASSFFFVLAGVFFLWQIVIVIYGFVCVMQMPLRTSIWVLTKSVILMLPVGLVVLLTFHSPTVAFIGHFITMEKAASRGRPDRALKHLEYLNSIETFASSRPSFAVRRLQLEMLLYRRWLPAYSRIRDRIARLRVSAAKPTVDWKAIGTEVEDLILHMTPALLTKEPMIDDQALASLKRAITTQVKRVKTAFRDEKLLKGWFLPYPHHIRFTLILCRVAVSRQNVKALEHHLSTAQACLDTGILAMQQRIHSQLAAIPKKVGSLQPAYEFKDLFSGLITGYTIFARKGK